MSKSTHRVTQQPPEAVALSPTETALFEQIQSVLLQARQQARRSVNQTMVLAYWQVGKLIVEHEQGGKDRAAYGAKTLQTLALRLSQEFGKGFSAPNLRNFRQFFLTYTQDEICYTPWLHNEDRHLTEHGGNPNLLWDVAGAQLVVIDHNQAFDPDFDAKRFLASHVFADHWNDVFSDHAHRRTYRARMERALQCLPAVRASIPESWW